MKPFVIYDETGRITTHGKCNDAEFDALLESGQRVIEADANPLDDYINAGRAHRRPALPTWIDGAVLRDLPENGSVWINGEWFQCHGGDADLILPPGEYIVTVSAWPYLSTHLIITADSSAQATEGRQTISIAPQPALVPSSISPAQARLALLGAGLLQQVEAAVAAADLVTQIAWSQATSIERDSPTVAGLSAALGLTSAQLDALFIAGASIRV